MAGDGTKSIKLNDSLLGHTKIQSTYETRFGFSYTAGIKALCDSFKNRTWWILDIILSFQPALFKEEFQRWEILKREYDLVLIICYDLSGKEIVHEIFSNKKIDGDCTLLIETNIILLPSEKSS